MKILPVSGVTEFGERFTKFSIVAHDALLWQAIVRV